MRLLPPTKSVSSTSETTSSCPTISLRSSVRMRSRPPFRRSASARSSGDSSAIVSVAKRSTRPPWKLPASSFRLFPTRVADLTALHREIRQQFLQLPGIPIRVHAVLQQLQRFNPLFERLALG